jgi:lysozyme
MSTDEREKLKLQLMRHEGIRLKPYQDTVGKWTIGVGRNISDKGITHDEAQFLLENDVDECIRDCQSFPWFRDLDAVRQRVIVDMAFNLGIAGLRRFRQTLASVERGAYDDAAAGMLRSLWARQVKGRAVRLAEMMRTGRDA